MSDVPGRPGGAPWWASGADDLDDHADPFTAHRAARRDPSEAGGPVSDTPRGGRVWDVDRDGDAWEDWDDRDPPAPDGAVRSTFEDAMDGLAALARAAARRAGRRDGGGRVHDPACRSCPWCTLTRSLGDARPEVTEHLEQAARHLVLAARAWVDAAEHRTGFERIPLDDDEEQQ